MFTFSHNLFSQKSIVGEIQKVNDEIRKEFKSGNMESMASYYTEDAMLIPPKSDILKGTDNIIAAWIATQGMGANDIKFQTKSAEKYGKIAVEQGEYYLLGAGDALIQKGKYIVIWEKNKGEWKMKKDIWNAYKL